MLKTFAKLILASIIMFIIQSSFLPIIHYNGIGPDLLLLMVISIAIFQGSKLGCFIGFIIGLIQDLATGNFFGVNTFTKMLVGYSSGFFSNRIFKDTFILPLATSILYTVASYLIAGGIMFLLGYRFNLLIHVTTHLIPMLCYNLLLSYPIYSLIDFILKDPSKKIKKLEKNKIV